MIPMVIEKEKEERREKEKDREWVRNRCYDIEKEKDRVRYGCYYPDGDREGCLQFRMFIFPTQSSLTGSNFF